MSSVSESVGSIYMCCLTPCTNMSRSPHLNEACHTYDRLRSRIRTSTVAFVECALDIVKKTSRVTHMPESCHAQDKGTSLIWPSHVAQMNASRVAQLAARAWKAYDMLL